MANVSIAVKLPSLTVKVTVVVHVWFSTGVILIVQFGAVPQTTTLLFGIKLIFDETAMTLPAHVNVLSTSQIVSTIPFIAVSSLVV